MNLVISGNYWKLNEFELKAKFPYAVISKFEVVFFQFGLQFKYANRTH